MVLSFMRKRLAVRPISNNQSFGPLAGETGRPVNMAIMDRNTKSKTSKSADSRLRETGGLALAKWQEIVRTKGLRVESGPDDS
ncbi:hypothetical protein [Sphingorhabdus sp. 109]|uniref:hypothetical protein n=1 Tax=Sphingorhabdus sp. 109 TaxID=2653173 RepID=UPI001F1C253D|nr:hypothetical protein [Sphingorhabdus sp. 109]